MPVYTYQCGECGVRFEAKQRFSDAPISVCPECGGATHKVIGPVGVVFKGSGFYVNDSRSNNSALSKPRKDGESGTASKTKSAETKPVESKTAASPSSAD